jgi:hypothetical protein
MSVGVVWEGGTVSAALQNCLIKNFGNTYIVIKSTFKMTFLWKTTTTKKQIC